MTDSRTTELLREGLTERGIEWRSGLEGVTFVGDWCFVEYDNGILAATCEPVLTPEQAIAATLSVLHDNPYVGLVRGKQWERHEMSDYYCGRCGWKVTDHDSYCSECGGAFHKTPNKPDSQFDARKTAETTENATSKCNIRDFDDSREEIVRCRDCCYYEPDGEPSAVDASWHWCDRMMQYLNPDGFCKWAERREVDA